MGRSFDSDRSPIHPFVNRAGAAAGPSALGERTPVVCATVPTAGGVLIRLTCFAHHRPPRTARLGRVSVLRRGRAFGSPVVCHCILAFSFILNREEGKGVRGCGGKGTGVLPGTAAQRWSPSPAELLTRVDLRAPDAAAAWPRLLVNLRPTRGIPSPAITPPRPPHPHHPCISVLDPWLPAPLHLFASSATFCSPAPALTRISAVLALPPKPMIWTGVYIASDRCRQFALWQFNQYPYR